MVVQLFNFGALFYHNCKFRPRVMSNPLSPVGNLIGRFEQKTNLNFKPTFTFYQTIGINRVRFSKIANGKKKPDSDEIASIVQYFNKFFTVTVDELVNLQPSDD